MRHFLVTLLLLAYPGLLFGLFWLPSSGPRQVLELSVAKNGSFTTSSSDHGYQRAIEDFDLLAVPVPLDLMIAHAQAVVCGSERALVVVDMPFGSYEEDPLSVFMRKKL